MIEVTAAPRKHKYSTQLSVELAYLLLLMAQHTRHTRPQIVGYIITAIRRTDSRAGRHNRPFAFGPWGAKWISQSNHTITLAVSIQDIRGGSEGARSHPLLPAHRPRESVSDWSISHNRS